MARAKVSVVVPVYRVEDYIRTCLDCLVNQTLKDLEIIFIDDCGGDGSIAIVEEYAANDERIVVLKNDKNLGAGPSRNRGIDRATGEYLAFVDPDDWVDQDFYEVLYERAKQRNYDIVKAKRVRVTVCDDGARRYSESGVNSQMKENLKKKVPLYSCFTSEHQAALFRTDMIQENGVYNGTSSHSENSVFLLGACYYAQSFTFEEGVAYYYLQREDSSVHTFDRKKFEGEASSFHEQMQFIEDHLLNDQALNDWLFKKLRFLLRRYDELLTVNELADYQFVFIEQLHNDLKILPSDNKKELVRIGGKRIEMLLNGELKKFMLVQKNQKALKMYKSLREKKRKIVSAIAKKTSGDPKSKDSAAASLPENDGFYRGLKYLQNFRGAIVMTEDFVESYPEFARDYQNSFVRDSELYNCDISSSSDLIAEHLELSKSGELCWRYVKRFGAISKTTIYIDSDGDLAMRGEILGSNDVIETDYFYIHPQENRKIIEGITLNAYLGKLRRRDKISELKDFLAFARERFDNGNGKLNGRAYDVFPYNCLIGENHTYTLFDLEFEYKEPLDFDYLVFKSCDALGRGHKKPVYFELCEHFGIVPKWQYWDDFNFRNWLDTISAPNETAVEDQVLFERYFLK